MSSKSLDIQRILNADTVSSDGGTRSHWSGSSNLVWSDSSGSPQKTASSRSNLTGSFSPQRTASFRSNLSGSLPQTASFRSNLSGSPQKTASFRSNLSGSPQKTASSRSNLSGNLNNLLEGYTNVSGSVESDVNMVSSALDYKSFLYKISGDTFIEKYDTRGTDNFLSKIKKLPIIRNGVLGSYKVTINKLTVRGGRKKALIQLLPDSNIHNLRADHKEEPNLVELSILVERGGKEVGCSLVIYYNGTVTITMGVMKSDQEIHKLLLEEVNVIKKGVIDIYFPQISGVGQFKNIAGQFKFQQTLSVPKLTQILSGTFGNVKLPQTEMPLAAFRFKNDETRVVIFPYSGMVQLMGSSTVKELVDTREKLISLFSMHRVGAGPAPVKAVRKVLGVAKKMKINKRAPGIVRKGRVCPKSRRPDEKDKCPFNTLYTKPNEHGDMCCYKLPKKVTKKLRAKVIAAYKKHNRNIPKSVKDALGISNNDINVAPTVNRNLINEFKVDADNGRWRIRNRLCSSLTRSELFEFAGKLGIIVDAKRSKAGLCKDIYDAWRAKRGYNRGLKNVDVLGPARRGMNTKVNGKMCKYWKKKDLLKWAKDRGIALDDKLRKPFLCKQLIDRAEKNTLFFGNHILRVPQVKINKNNKILLNNRFINIYSTNMLKQLANKLDLPLPKSGDPKHEKYNILRRFDVKYIKKPKVTTRGNELFIMNRGSYMYNITELRQLARKIPGVSVPAAAREKEIINAIVATTSLGNRRLRNTILNKFRTKNKNQIVKMLAQTSLTPLEQIKVMDIYKTVSTQARDLVTKEHRKDVRDVNRELTVAREQLVKAKKINNILSSNVDNLKKKIRTLKAKQKRLSSQDLESKIYDTTISNIYKQLVKTPEYRKRYDKISRLPNVTMGAISLAKLNLQRIVSTLMDSKNKKVVNQNKFNLKILPMLHAQLSNEKIFKELANNKNYNNVEKNVLRDAYENTKIMRNIVEENIARDLKNIKKKQNGPSNIVGYYSKQEGMDKKLVQRIYNNL